MSDYGTVGDILRQNPQLPGEGVPDEPVARIMPPRLEGQPEFPAPGIYFGMSDEQYHSINACSSSLIKDAIVSPMLAWARSPLNPEREDDDTFVKVLGRAYHARICEGASAYAMGFALALDKRDYPDALVTSDDIKAAIAEAGEKAVTRIGTGVFGPSPTKAEPDRQKEITRAASKPDWIAQMLEISPDAQIWDRLNDEYIESIGNRTLIPADADKRIQIAAKMIEADPELSKAFSGGYAEVSLFWFDEATGAPCKARIDYLKMNAFVDLKSFSLKTERPVDRAIDYEIASRRHYIPVVHYGDGIAAVKKLIAGPPPAEHIHCPDDWTADQITAAEQWACKWALVKDDPTPLYVFQATGIAPITRGKILQRGTVYTITRMAVEMMRQRYVEMVKTYGADPWLDVASISAITDENVPQFGTDFGDN